MDVRGEDLCGDNDHGARLYPAISTPTKANLLQVIWQKDKYTEWLIQHRRGPLGNPRHWYVFNLMPEIEGCTSLGADADSIADTVNAVRAYTLFMDDVRDTIERDYELRVRPAFAMFAPQLALRNESGTPEAAAPLRYPEGWWDGLMTEDAVDEEDNGFYIRVLRRLAAAENIDGGNLLADVDWSPTEAQLFQEFYLYNVEDHFTGPPEYNLDDPTPTPPAATYTPQPHGVYTSGGSVYSTPYPVATLQILGENAAMRVIYTAADLYMMKVIPEDITQPYTQTNWIANNRPVIVGQFGIGGGNTPNCVGAATLNERYKCRALQEYQTARMLQPFMQRFEDYQDNNFTLPNGGGTTKVSNFLVGVSYWTPITIAGFVYPEVKPLQHFNYFDGLHGLGSLLDWQLTNFGGANNYSVAYSPLGRVYLRGAAGFFSGPNGNDYPKSSTTIYNPDQQIGATLRYVDPWLHGSSASWSKSNDYSDWERNVRASVNFSGSNVTGTCTIDGFNPTNGVVYFLRDLSIDTYLTSKEAGTFSNASLSDGSETTANYTKTTGHVYQMVCYNKDDYTNRNMANATAP